MQHKRHPEFFRWFDRPFWNVLLCLAARRSRRLIAVSEATARDIARFFPWAANKAAVVPHGVDREFFRIGEMRREHPELVDPYILAVSTLHPHKNIERLMDAFRIFRHSHGEFRLVVAGLKGFAADRLESRRRALGLEDSVVFTGWIPRSELYALFERASAFVAPALFEGFGMPVIEALAAGLPSACSAIAPFDPLADGVAARFDPLSVAQIAAAMEMIVTDSAFRSQAAASGPLRARPFYWQRTAELTLAELRSAYNMSRK
jgi:glycosyltransferase involved in cell wall biosynthesis